MGHEVQGGLRKPRLLVWRRKGWGGEEYDCDLQLLKGQEGARFLSEVCSQRAIGNGHNLHPGKFSAWIRRKKNWVREVKPS